MQRIINDLLYDTETAELVFVEEGTNRKLYKTPHGNYFTFFATGEIQPKTVESTKAYLGKFAVDVYVKEFGEPEKA